MNHNIIQVDYETLESVAQVFEEAAQSIDEMLQEVQRGRNNLLDEWIGEGSEAFFRDMDDEVLPVTERLRDALTEASMVARRGAVTYRGAEEAAAALFTGLATSIVGVQAQFSPGSSEPSNSRGDESPPIPAPPDLPPSGTGDGSGEHGAAGDPTDEDWETYRTMEWLARLARLGELDISGRHMQHFLGNSGEPLQVNVNRMLKEMPEFHQVAQLQFRQQVLGEVNQQIAANDSGQPMQFEVSTPWRSDYYPDKKEYPDWYYGVGGFSYSQSAVVIVTPNPEGGNPLVTVQSQVHMFDRYNWDDGKAVTLPSSGNDWIDEHTIAGDFIPDEQMGRLHTTGIAQEYNLHGSSSTQTTTYVYDPTTGGLTDPPTDGGRGR